MSQPPKRSTTPDDKPSWVTRMVEEMFRLRNAMEHQSASINEIRSILLPERHPRSKQQTANRLSNSSAHDHALSSSSSRAHPIRSSSNQRIASTTLRSAPIAIPRPSQPNVNQRPIQRHCAQNTVQSHAMDHSGRPDASTLPKICWYHKQFGQASTNCIEPCSFMAPIIPDVPAIPLNKRKIRSAVLLKPPTYIDAIVTAVIPEAVADPMQISQPMEQNEQSTIINGADQVAGTSSGLKPADWNLSEQSSSSSSDSDSSDDKKPAWRQEKQM